MFKSIIKEIGIMLLLLIAIVLLLGIILYDYNPNDKTIPDTLAEYKLPEYVGNELEGAKVSEPQNIVKTYKVKEEDLDSYEETNEYDRGKINPFKLSNANINDIAGVNNTTGILDPILK